MTRALLVVLALSAGAAVANMPPPMPTEPAVAPSPVQAAPAPEPAPAAVHPAGIEKAVPTGVIEGGWGYVIGAWSVAGLGLMLYTLSLVVRRPKTGAP